MQDVSPILTEPRKYIPPLVLVYISIILYIAMSLKVALKNLLQLHMNLKWFRVFPCHSSTVVYYIMRLSHMVFG